MKKSVVEIVLRNIEELKPHPDNPRKAEQQDIEALAQSIQANKEFFTARPILLSDRTGELVIIGGERRWEAAKLLGLSEVPTILLHGLDEEKEGEIMIRDNTHSGVWDEVRLKEWGDAELKDFGVDVVFVSKINIKELFNDDESKSVPAQKKKIRVFVPAEYELDKVREFIIETLSSFAGLVVK